MKTKDPESRKQQSNEPEEKYVSICFYCIYPTQSNNGRGACKWMLTCKPLGMKSVTGGCQTGGTRPPTVCVNSLTSSTGTCNSTPLFASQYFPPIDNCWNSPLSLPLYI